MKTLLSDVWNSIKSGGNQTANSLPVAVGTTVAAVATPILLLIISGTTTLLQGAVDIIHAGVTIGSKTWKYTKSTSHELGQVLGREYAKKTKWYNPLKWVTGATGLIGRGLGAVGGAVGGLGYSVVSDGLSEVGKTLLGRVFHIRTGVVASYQRMVANGYRNVAHGLKDGKSLSTGSRLDDLWKDVKGGFRSAVRTPEKRSRSGWPRRDRNIASWLYADDLYPPVVGASTIPSHGISDSTPNPSTSHNDGQDQQEEEEDREGGDDDVKKAKPEISQDNSVESSGKSKNDDKQLSDQNLPEESVDNGIPSKAHNVDDDTQKQAELIKKQQEELRKDRRRVQEEDNVDDDSIADDGGDEHSDDISQTSSHSEDVEQKPEFTGLKLMKKTDVVTSKAGVRINIQGDEIHIQDQKGKLSKRLSLKNDVGKIIDEFSKIDDDTGIAMNGQIIRKLVDSHPKELEKMLGDRGPKWLTKDFLIKGDEKWGKQLLKDLEDKLALQASA